MKSRLPLAALLTMAASAFAMSPAHSFAQPADAQDAQSPPAQSPSAAAGAGPVVINREALRLIDPKAFQVTLQLEPIRSVEVAAPAEGRVQSVPAKSGETVDVQAEVVRLDSTEQQLELERARSNYKVAQIEAKRTTAKGEPDASDLADARLAAAKAELDLASYRAERASVRAPLKGKVFRVHVVEGQFVQIGNPLLMIGDTSKLKVEIPVDRKDPEIAAGKQIEIRIEDQTIKGTIETVLPLSPRFEPIRELINSVATAVVVVDNAGGKFAVGQTVYAPLIPRNTVTEIPTAALANVAEGGRKVQVVREDVIRDVKIELLGQVGDDRVYVSGPFADKDELVVSASQELPDGTRIRPSAGVPASGAASKPAAGNQPPRRGTGGF